MTNTTKPGPGLRILSLERLLRLELGEGEYLLEPWLKDGESALIWAAPGVGKTMLTLSLALAVAGGGEVLGWKATKPRKVLIVDGEMAVRDIQSRLRTLIKTVEGMDHEAAGKNLNVLARHRQDPHVEFIDLGDKAAHKGLLRQIMEYGPELVIFDNLSTLAALEDENSASAMQVIVQFLAKLKQAGIATLVIHHANKGGSSYRGSTMLATTFEVIIGLLREAKGDLLDTSGNARFRLQWDKFRGLKDARVRDAEVCLEDTPSGLRWTSMPPADEALEAIAQMVRSGRYASQQAVLRDLPVHLWPNKAARPSKGWLSKQFALAHAHNFLPRKEAEAFFTAAREDRASALGEPDDDLSGPAGQLDEDPADELHADL